jgi:hypothetical protein
MILVEQMNHAGDGAAIEAEPSVAIGDGDAAHAAGRKQEGPGGQELVDDPEWDGRNVVLQR